MAQSDARNSTRPDTKRRRYWPVWVAGLVLFGAMAASGWQLWYARQAYYSDADTINQPADTAVVRDILWQPPQRLDELINTLEDDYEPRPSADGRLLYLVRGKAGENADIYCCERTLDGWSRVAPLERINSEFDDLGPEPSADGKKIYFYRDYIKSVHIPNLDYLKTFEKKYKIDLWYVAYADPNFDRYEKPNRFNETEILSLLEDDCRFYEEILQKINPNFLIIQTGSLKHLVLLELMCKSLGVKILKFGPARFGKNFQISRDYDLLDELKESRKNNTKLERMSDKDVEKLHHELDMSDIVYPRSGIGNPKLSQKNFVINFLIHYSKMKKAF